MSDQSVDRSIAAYLVFARDQLPTAMGEVTRWGYLKPDDNTFKEAADFVAQSWKQCGLKFRRKCYDEAKSNIPHAFFPDPTPYQVLILLNALQNEKHHSWCMDEYSMAEEPSDDDEDDDNNDDGQVSMKTWLAQFREKVTINKQMKSKAEHNKHINNAIQSNISEKKNNPVVIGDIDYMPSPKDRM